TGGHARRCVHLAAAGPVRPGRQRHPGRTSMSLDTHLVSVLAREQDTPLARAHRHGLVTAGDVQLASHVTRMFGSSDELVKLTAALCLAISRAGSTCLDLDTAADRFIDDVLQTRDLTAAELSVART